MKRRRPEKTTHGFGWAIEEMEAGKFVQRPHFWGYLFLKNPLPTDVGAPTVPCIMMVNDAGDIHPWHAASDSILAKDWVSVSVEEVPEE